MLNVLFKTLQIQILYQEDYMMIRIIGILCVYCYEVTQLITLTKISSAKTTQYHSYWWLNQLFLILLLWLRIILLKKGILCSPRLRGKKVFFSFQGLSVGLMKNCAMDITLTTNFIFVGLTDPTKFTIGITKAQKNAYCRKYES